jgi:hypothetical protein
VAQTSNSLAGPARFSLAAGGCEGLQVKLDRLGSPRAKIAKTAFVYPGQFEAPWEQRAFARVIVRDNLSGRTGTITVQMSQN